MGDEWKPYIPAESLEDEWVPYIPTDTQDEPEIDPGPSTFRTEELPGFGATDIRDYPAGMTDDSINTINQVRQTHGEEFAATLELPFYLSALYGVSLEEASGDAFMNAWESITESGDKRNTLQLAKDYYTRGQYNFAISQVGMSMTADALTGNYENFDKYKEEISRLYGEMPGQMDESQVEWYKRIFVKGAEMMPMMANAAVEAMPFTAGAAVAAGGVSLATGGLGALPAMAWVGGTWTAAFTTSLVKQMTGSNMIRMTQQDDVDPMVAAWASLGIGIAQGVIETAQFSKVVKLIPGQAKGLGRIFQNAIDKTMGSGGAATKIAKGIMRGAGTYTQEMLEEEAQYLIEAFGDDVVAATEQYLLGKDVEYNTIQDVLAGMKQTWDESKEPILGMVGAGSVMGIMVDVMTPEAKVAYEEGLPTPPDPTDILLRDKAAQAESEDEFVSDVQARATDIFPAEEELRQMFAEENAGRIAEEAEQTLVEEAAEFDTPEEFIESKEETEETQPLTDAWREAHTTDEMRESAGELQGDIDMALFETADEFVAFAHTMYEEEALPDDQALREMYEAKAPEAEPADPATMSKEEWVENQSNTPSGMTTEDIELKPEITKNISGAAMIQDGKVYGAPYGKGAMNHYDIVEKYHLDYNKTIPGFIDKQGNFLYQYKEDVPSKTRAQLESEWEAAQAPEPTATVRTAKESNDEFIASVDTKEQVTALLTELGMHYETEVKRYRDRGDTLKEASAAIASQWDNSVLANARRMMGRQGGLGDAAYKSIRGKLQKNPERYRLLMADLRGDTDAMRELQTQMEGDADFGPMIEEAQARAGQAIEEEAAGADVVEGAIVDPERRTTKQQISRAVEGVTMERLMAYDDLLKVRLAGEARGAKVGMKAQRDIQATRNAIKKEQDKLRGYRDDIKSVLSKTEEMDPKYRDEIQDLVDGIDLVFKRTEKKQVRLRHTAEFLAQNPDHDLPASVLKDLATLDKTRFGDLTPTQIEDLHDAVMTAAALNKRKQTIRTNLRDMKRDRAARGVEQELPPENKKLRKYKGEQELTRLQKAERWAKDTAQLGEARPDVVVLKAVGDGIGYDVWIRQVEQAMTRYRGLKQDMKSGFADELEETGFNYKKDISKWVSEDVTTGEWSLTRDQRMALYLHSLDQDNRESITEGGVGFRHDGYPNVPQGLTSEEYGAILDSLTEAEITFAEAARPTFKKGGEALNKAFFDINWHDMKVRENYMTKSVMPTSRAGGADAETESYRESVKQQNFRIGVQKGMTKERADSRKPIYLDGLSVVLNNNFENNASYIALEEVLQNAHNLLYDQGVKDAFARRKGGDAVWRYIDKYLQDVAGSKKVHGELTGSIQKIHSGFVGYSLMGNVKVAIQQAFSLPFSMVYENPVDLFLGTYDTMRHPIKSDKQHSANSPDWVERKKGFSTDLAASLAKGAAQSEILKHRPRLKEILSAPTRWFDKFAVSATMNSSVRRAMREFKKGDLSYKVKRALGDNVQIPTDPDAQLKLAYQYAEFVAKRTQPTFSVETLSALRRGTDLEQTLTWFSSFTNQENALLSRAVYDAKNGHPAALVAFSLAFVGNALGMLTLGKAQKALRGDEPDDKDTVFRSLIDAFAGMHFVVRDIARAVKWDKDTIGLPVFQILNEVVNAANSIEALAGSTNSKERDNAALDLTNAALNITFMRSGVPYPLVGRPVKKIFKELKK